jgi:predicted MFS family arabinose efflux permease
MSEIRRVLHAKQVIQVLGSSIVGRLPLGAAPLALLLAARETESIAVAGVAVAAYTAGIAIGQPVAARLADRWRQVPVLWSAVALSTSGFGLAAVTSGAAVLVGAALAAGLGAPPFEAFLRVLWRDLVDAPLVPAAYTVDITSQEIIFITGPLLTSGAVAVGGPRAGLFVAAAVQLLGAVVFTAAPAVRRWRGEDAPRHWAGPLQAARMRLLLLTGLLLGAGVGGVAVALVAYAEDQGDRAMSGWLLAAQGGGALIGGLFLARRARSWRLPVTVAALAIGYLPAVATPAPVLMLLAVTASGVMLPAALTGVIMVADEVAPAGTAAEAFAWTSTSFAVGSALGAALDGQVLDRFGTVTGLLLAPLALAAAALTTLPRAGQLASDQGTV